MSEIVVPKPTLREALRKHTPARVGLERVGVAIATGDQLAFQLDHALARDAVHARVDVGAMLDGIKRMGLDGLALRSAIEAGPAERQTYLRRPDLGRRLAAESAQKLTAGEADVVFVIADGLSALAVERHASQLLAAVMARLNTREWKIGPVCVVTQGRVAVGDEIGSLLGARLVVMLIGERPGLSAADSLGIYITWQPRVGCTDAERNCISNVRAEGLSYAEAADRIVAQMEAAKRLEMTGVGLRTLGSGGSNPLIA